MKKMSEIEFVKKFCEAMGGDGFFMIDSIGQDELFKMQDSVADLIIEQANAGLPLAIRMSAHFPRAFSLNYTK